MPDLTREQVQETLVRAANFVLDEGANLWDERYRIDANVLRQLASLDPAAWCRVVGEVTPELDGMFRFDAVPTGRLIVTPRREG